MSGPPIGPIRVLHVDDESDFGEMTARMLEREDDRLSVDYVTSPAAGLERLGEDTDCIVSDYDMQGIDGIEFLEAVREERPEVPFILFTGKGSEEVASEAISAGVTDYVQKTSGTSHYTVLANRIDNAVRQYYAERRARERERELERQNDLFEKTQGLANVGAWEYDLENEEVYWTDEVARIHGFTYGNTQTIENPFEFYHPEDQPVLRDAFDRAATEGEAYDLTLRLIRTDGEQRWVRTRGEPQYEDGEIVRLRGTLQDVTERKEREQELRRHEAIVEALGDAVYAVDDDGYIVYVNERYAEMKRVSPEELLGTQIRRWIDEEEAEKVYDLIEEFKDENDDVGKMEYRFSTADGELIPAELRFTHVEFPDGTQGRVGVIRDISERKERERELKQYERIIEEINDGIVVVQDGLISDVNPQQSELMGYTAEELRGEPMPEFIAPEYRETVQRRYRERIAGKDPPRTYEISILSKENEEIPVEITAARVEYDDQPATVSIVRDIRERKQRERELKRQNERLDEFTGVVSHDLRNPLNVAMAWLEEAKEECDSHALDRVGNAHDRMNALIDDLLALAQEGETVTDIEPVDLTTLVETCWQIVETAEATLQVEPGLETVVRADKGRLKQLVENLIANAVEHGGEDVIVRIGELEDGFYIEDTGPGIPEDKHEDVFEAGYSTSEEGTGFGLRIVKQVVEAHGWSIRVTSGSDGGARFEITDIETGA